MESRWPTWSSEPCRNCTWWRGCSDAGLPDGSPDEFKTSRLLHHFIPTDLAFLLVRHPSQDRRKGRVGGDRRHVVGLGVADAGAERFHRVDGDFALRRGGSVLRSEEHTSEL